MRFPFRTTIGLALFGLVLALSTPSSVPAQELDGFQFGLISAIGFPKTNSLIVGFSTLNDSDVDSYELQWARISLLSGVGSLTFHPFPQPLPSQKSDATDYYFEDSLPSGWDSPDTLFVVRIVAHLEGGNLVYSEWTPAHLPRIKNPRVINP